MQALAATQPCHLATGQGVSELPWPQPAKKPSRKLWHASTASPSACGHPSSGPVSGGEPSPHESRRDVLNHRRNVAKLWWGEWGLGQDRGNGWLASGSGTGPPRRSWLHLGGAGKGREQAAKILVPTKRKWSPFIILHICIKWGKKAFQRDFKRAGAPRQTSPEAMASVL